MREKSTTVIHFNDDFYHLPFIGRVPISHSSRCLIRLWHFLEFFHSFFIQSPRLCISFPLPVLPPLNKKTNTIKNRMCARALSLSFKLQYVIVRSLYHSQYFAQCMAMIWVQVSRRAKSFREEWMLKKLDGDWKTERFWWISAIYVLDPTYQKAKRPFIYPLKNHELNHCRVYSDHMIKITVYDIYTLDWIS